MQLSQKFSSKCAANAGNTFFVSRFLYLLIFFCFLFFCFFFNKRGLTKCLHFCLCCAFWPFALSFFLFYLFCCINLLLFCCCCCNCQMFANAHRHRRVHVASPAWSYTNAREYVSVCVCGFSRVLMCAWVANLIHFYAYILPLSSLIFSALF